jgi:transposase
MSLEQYTESDRTDHEIAKVQIETRVRGVGRDEGITARELAKTVPVSESTVRELAQELREEHRLPVAAGPNGYYHIGDPDELADELQRIEDVIQTKRETKQNLTAAFNRS